MNYKYIAEHASCHGPREAFTPGPIRPQDFGFFGDRCLSLDRGSVLVEVAHDPDRCDDTHYIVTLCSMYRSHDHTAFCSYLRGADLETAANALLEAHRRIQSGIDHRALTDIPLRTTATLVVDDDSTACGSWKYTTFQMCQRTEITELRPDEQGGHTAIGTVAEFGFLAHIGGPGTPAGEQLDGSGITSLMLWERATNQPVAQFDARIGPSAMLCGDDAACVIHHLCRGLAGYVWAKASLPNHSLAAGAPR